MGYLHQDCYSAVDMMAPVVNDLVILKDEAGSVYWPMFGLNSIGNMCPGKGYQVKMSATTLFNYPLVAVKGLVISTQKDQFILMNLLIQDLI